ncbi:Sad1-interacting factor 2 [Podosphaera aphanis]|nr:Sad1-interacting factor 2 [Podosphaera aphanis]
MDAATEECAPLIPPHASSPKNLSPTTSRHMTFNSNAVRFPIGDSSGPTQNTIPFSAPAQQPIFSALNSRLRRSENLRPLISSTATVQNNVSKIGPQRSTKNVQKLKLLPNLDFGDDGPDEESGRDVYSQYTRIKDPTARRDAARLGKADRDRLPRVTAYCTASKYQLENMMRFLKSRRESRSTNPKLVDECLYSPYKYDKPYSSHTSMDMVENRSTIAQTQEDRHSTFKDEGRYQSPPEDLIEIQTGEESALNGNESTPQNYLESSESIQDFDIQVHTPEVFLFNYGVVVIWGMSFKQEQRFLKEIAKFENEKLSADDVETECFNFYYTQEYQARIYNDFITLRDKRAYMTKLAISHALAQSVKTSLFEELVDNTIEECKDIPGQIATTGKIALSRTQINMQIGELFILRINIHLNGSVLDTPEIFWLEPQLEPVYQAVRSYLEMDQRVSLLTERLDVIADLLAVLKDQLSHGHGEMLEWIVIVLIAAEILVAAVNIVVDLYSGVD